MVRFDALLILTFVVATGACGTSRAPGGGSDTPPVEGEARTATSLDLQGGSRIRLQAEDCARVRTATPIPGTAASAQATECGDVPGNCRTIVALLVTRTPPPVSPEALSAFATVCGVGPSGTSRP